MADDAPSNPATPPSGGSPFDEFEEEFDEEFEDEFGGNPFAGGQEDPFAGGAFGNEPPAVMMAKFWIRQNALLAVGVAFAAGTFIGALQK